MIFGTHLLRPLEDWTPRQIQGLVAWYHAGDMATSVDTPGGQAGFVPVLGDDSGGARTISSSNVTCPTYSAAAMGARGGLLFSAAAACQLQVATAQAADWTFLHDGTGCSAVFTARPTATPAVGMVVDTTGIGTGRGASIYHDGVLDRWVAVVRNASGIILQLAGASGSAPKNADYVVAFQYSASASPQASLRANGVELAHGNATGAPSSLAPQFGGACIGRLQAANGDYFEGHVRDAFFARRVLVAAELTAAETRALGLQSPRRLRRLWTVGDSITKNGHYQQEIWIRQLAPVAYRLDFLGTQLSPELPMFVDRQMDGYDSKTIQEIQALVNGIDIGPNAPDDVLLIAGTNNAGDDMATAQAAYGALVQMLAAQRPTSTIRLGRPPRRLDTTPKHDWVEAFALFVQSYAAANGHPYAPTDVQSDAQVQGDGVHPTNAGYAVLGDVWADNLGL